MSHQRILLHYGNEVENKMTPCLLKISEAVANFVQFQKGEGTVYSDDLNVIVHSPSVSSELPLEFAYTPRGRKKELIFFCVRLF